MDGPLELLDGAESLDGRRDVVRDGPGEIEVVRRRRVRAIVIDHELAYERVAGDERNERQSSNALCREQIAISGPGRICHRVSDDEGLWCGGVARPRRMPLDRTPIAVGQPPPRL